MTEEKNVTTGSEKIASGDSTTTGAIERIRYWGVFAFGIVCAALIWMKLAFRDINGWSMWALYASLLGSYCFVSFDRTKRKSTLVLGAIEALTVVCYVVTEVMILLGK